MHRSPGLSLALLTALGFLTLLGVARGEARQATPAATTEPDAAKSLGRRVYEEVLTQGNMAVIDELFAPGYIDHQVVPGLPPNREGLKQSVALFQTAFPDGRFVIEDLVAEGDRVAIRSTFHGTHEGEFAGIPASSQQVEFASIDILRIEDGRVIEHWGVSDDLGLLTQLGAIPAPAATGTPAP